MADRSPREIVESALAALRSVEAELGQVGPRLRVDPGWNEIDKAVKRAIAAAAAVAEYATVRPDKFAAGNDRVA
jgi:hypothetical protein